VVLLEDDDKQLPELKALYDELWSDAKTLIKDMKKSVSVYLYAGLVTIIVGFYAIINAIPYFLIVFFGKGGILAWSVVVAEVIATVIILSFGARLLMWYRKLNKRYAKLIQMEKIGD
jgi:VIT1/CCC1 family predicted Fe2+/Mn2+ transporter